MRGDLYIDFAVAMALFVFAFVSIFYYLDSQADLKIQSEELQVYHLKIQDIFDSLPREQVLKRIILAEGSSTNEFVNLSDYDIDLILDENNDAVCFDPDLEGFVANVSDTKFYLYSTKTRLNREICEIQNFNDELDEKISTPIYEDFFMELPDVNKTGNFCNTKPILIFSGKGVKKENLKICVD